MTDDSTSQPPQPNKGGRPKPKNSFALLRDRGWLTLREFAVVADVSYQAVLNWCRTDQIRYIQVGGMKRVYEEEIQYFLQHGTRPGDPEKLKAVQAKRKEYQNAYYRK